MLGGIGNKIYTESRDENFRLFMQIYRITGIVIIWCATMMLALYQPFIRVWVGEKNANMEQHFRTAALMVIFFYVNQSRQVLQTYKSAGGLWKQDQWKPIVNGVVKLALGLSFIFCLPTEYKLDGVILASIIGFLFVEIPWEAHVVFTALFQSAQAKIYWRTQALMVLKLLVPCAVTSVAIWLIPVEGLYGLMLKALVALALASSLVILVFRKDVFELKKVLLSKH